VRAVREVAHVQSAAQGLTRDINRDSLLERIRAMQPISRVDLARASGLQPSTVSSIVEQLLRERWILEGAAIETARGRRPTHLRLNDDIVILVADVHPAQAILAVVDVNGRFLSRKVVPLGSDPEQGVKSLASGMRQLQEQHPGKTFEGVGLAMPGRIDPETHQLILAPNLKWHDFDIRSALTEEMGLRVELENAANACLLSELWFGRIDGIHNAVLVTIAEGVGAAILAEGRLISGRRGLAGEFGHICVDPTGPTCGCGLKGCWEVFASSAAALRYYKELKPKAGKISIAELAGCAMNGDRPALEALNRQATAIGRGLRMITAALSPDIILLAGDINIFWELSKDIIEQEYAAGLLTDAAAEVIPLGDGEQALLRGAAAVVLQRHTGYYRAAHSRDKEPATDTFQAPQHA
jgi:predicted NBD/HSP70 family sugar kinase